MYMYTVSMWAPAEARGQFLLPIAKSTQPQPVPAYDMLLLRTGIYSLVLPPFRDILPLTLLISFTKRHNTPYYIESHPGNPHSNTPPSDGETLVLYLVVNSRGDTTIPLKLTPSPVVSILRQQALQGLS